MENSQLKRFADEVNSSGNGQAVGGVAAIFQFLALPFILCVLYNPLRNGALLRISHPCRASGRLVRVDMFILHTLFWIGQKETEFGQHPLIIMFRNFDSYDAAVHWNPLLCMLSLLAALLIAAAFVATAKRGAAPKTQKKPKRVITKKGW